MIALHKKGSKHQTCNYRPVSLTLVAGKMLEAIVKKCIMYHLTTIGQVLNTILISTNIVPQILFIPHMY